MKESVQTIIFHLVVKLDDIDVDEVSQCVDKVLEAVPRDHLPVFFCGREDSCLVHQDLIINREWKHEKKHGNAQSQRSIKCLENKFNLLIPWSRVQMRRRFPCQSGIQSILSQLHIRQETNETNAS